MGDSDTKFLLIIADGLIAKCQSNVEYPCERSKSDSPKRYDKLKDKKD